MNIKYFARLIAFALISLSGCTDIEDEIIPLARVRIEVSPPLQSIREFWANSPATYVTFIMPNIPNGFAEYYTASSATGYGGVLQVCGYDGNLYAFDLSCPYEHRPNIRVYIDSEYKAKCKECGSTFRVFDGSGFPESGPALKRKYAMRSYYVRKFQSGSYIITNN